MHFSEDNRNTFLYITFFGSPEMGIKIPFTLQQNPKGFFSFHARKKTKSVLESQINLENSLWHFFFQI